MFKFIKNIFKSKKNEYLDNADYSRNTNDSSHWKDKQNDSSKETRLGNMILLISIIATYLLWLLPKSEILKTLYEHGYWYVIAIYMALFAICAILFVPATGFFIFLWISKKHLQYSKEYGKFLFSFLCGSYLSSFVIGIPFDDFFDSTVKEINHTEMTPSYTIRTVITDKYKKSSCIVFKVGDKIDRVYIHYSLLDKYNIGDSIMVVYGKGCLGITDAMEGELIDHSS